MSGVEKLRVLVLHSDDVVEAGLRAIVASNADMEVVEHTSVDAPGDEEATILVKGAAGVLVTDYARGLRAAHQARRAPLFAGLRYPSVLVFTERDSQAEIRLALEAGVQGYLLCGCPAANVSDGLRMVSKGVRYLSQFVSSRLVEDMFCQRLTAREDQVLGFVAAGAPNKVIADQLGVEVATIKVHVAAILEKLGARNRTQAVAIATRRGLFTEAAARNQARAPSCNPGATARHEAAWAGTGSLRTAVGGAT